MSGLRSLSTLTGHYDFPSASPPQSHDRNSYRDSRSRLQRIRQTLAEERRDRRAAAETASLERRRTLEAALMPPSPNTHRARSAWRNAIANRLNERADAEASSNAASNNITAANGDRPRAVPTGRYSQSHRRRQESEDTLSGGLQGLEEAGVRLAQLSSNIEEILDQSTPPGLASSLPPSLPPQTENHQHRAKRRKLDTVRNNEFTNHKYGWFGQVEASRLKMEIASCDGDYYANDTDSTMYRPENILRKDKSVYCTKRSKCDIILRHQGETPFSVDKILIKWPEQNLPAPIQEGMIFVSMTADDLLRRTADYNYTLNRAATRTSTPSRPPTTSRSPERLTLLESLHDPLISEAARPRTTTSDNIPPYALRNPTTTRERRFPSSSTDDDPAGENCDPPLDDNNNNNSNPSSHHTAVTTTVDPPTALSDTDDDEEEEDDEGNWSDSIEALSPVEIADRLRQEGQWPPTNEVAEALQYQFIRERDEAVRLARRNGGGAGGSGTRTARATRTGRRSTMAGQPQGEGGGEDAIMAQARRAGGLDGRASSRAPSTFVRGELLVPDARFRMKDRSNQRMIKFEPPVSGKYILIKLWNPGASGNIDIQSITTYGYSGPRFAPAMKSR
ncbi:MAG: hypothetical protein M1821_008903 [Bathelium mastoideum]|nr:MAG: hypothetical protein M1821_008903 [Bathelium mastoideum]